MKKVLLWSMLVMLTVVSVLLTACSGDEGETCFVSIDLGYLYEETYGSEGREIELEVKEGTTLDEPELREIEGYTFDKWVIWGENSMNYQEWSFDTPISLGENGNPHIRIEALYTRDQFKYKLNDAGNGYIAEKLIYTSANEDFAIVVPDTYRGLPVVAVADGACDYENSSSQGSFDRATHVTIGKNVKTIGERAFAGRINDWENRYDLVIPSSVTSIGAYAFQNCTAKKIVLPEGLTEIKPYTFDGCGSAFEISIPSTVTKIGEYAFQSFGDWAGGDKESSGISMILPEGITEIGAHAFASSGIASITLPKKLTAIAPYTFEQCEKLVSIAIPEGVTSIGEGAFSNANLSGGVTLPATLTVIEKEAFTSSSLATITVPASVKEIGEGAFKRAQLTSAKLLAGVEVVGAGMFEDCINLATVELPDTLKKIGINAFKNTAFFKALRVDGYGLYYGSYLLGNTGYVNYHAEIAEGTVLIADGAFGVHGLEYLTLPTSLKYIGEKAFAGARSLQEITIPEGVIEIGAYAFSGCNSLLSAILPASLQSMKEGVFSECGMLERVTLASGLTEIPDETFLHCTALTEISLPTGVTKIGRSAFQGCESLSNVTLPNGVTELGAYVFCGCDSLTQITLPAGIKEIPSYAFADSGLVSVVLPEGLMLIMDHAFVRCRLQSLNLPTETPLSIWDEAFLGNLQLTELVIPANVRSVYPRAFAGCNNLTSVTLLHTEGGWKMTHPELGINQGGRKTFTCAELSDPTIVAQYLIADYLEFQWAYDPELVK